MGSEGRPPLVGSHGCKSDPVLSESQGRGQEGKAADPNCLSFQVGAEGKTEGRAGLEKAALPEAEGSDAPLPL